MKISKYTATDMRAALRLVREKLGENAVIISSRRTKGGVEVTAAIDFDAVRSARPTLIGSRVGVAHNEAAFVIGKIQFIAHHLAISRARTLTAIGLADVERCRAVRVYNDPRIELLVIWIGIQISGLCARALCLSLRAERQTDDKQP